MPEPGYNDSDKREECPECGGKSFHIQRHGPTLYVVCDGDCNDYIIGELTDVDNWCGGLA